MNYQMSFRINNDFYYMYPNGRAYKRCGLTKTTRRISAMAFLDKRAQRYDY